MKKIFTYSTSTSSLIFYITISLLMIISSCSVQKRMYRPGYTVNWKNVESQSNNHSVQSEEVSIIDKELTTGSLSSDECTIPSDFEPTKKVKQDAICTTNSPDSTDCDIIILENGTEIKAEIKEIGTEGITYTKCGDDSKTLLSVKIDDVSEVKIHTNSIKSDSRVYPKNYASAKNEPLGIAGLVCSVIPFIFPLGGLLAIIFGAISLNRINREPNKFKGKGFALASLIIGIVEILLIAAIIIILILIW